MLKDSEAQNLAQCIRRNSTFTFNIKGNSGIWIDLLWQVIFFLIDDINANK